MRQLLFLYTVASAGISKTLTMKKLLPVLTGLFFSLVSSAQFPGGMPSGGKGAAAAPSIGHFYGKIVSDSLGKPLEGATVILLQNRLDTVSKKRKDVLVIGLLTKANGEFSFEDLPMFGSYKLKISAIGYKNFEKAISFQIKMGGG